MQMYLEPQLLRNGVEMGAEAADDLSEHGQRIGTLAGFVSGHVDAGAGAAVRRIADRLSGEIADVRARLDQFESMIERLNGQSWMLGSFGNEDLQLALLALTGLADPDAVTTSVRDIVTHVQDLNNDRDWMESLTAQARRQWLVLLSLRWLPKVNADGTGNCFDGVLHYFQDHGLVTLGSFASMVDANILCAFADGLARTLGIGGGDDTRQWAPGSAAWQRFFTHQLRMPPGILNDESIRLWHHAEQPSTEAGYAWAARHGVTTTQLVEIITLGSEIYRWTGRQRGLWSDPLPLVAGAGSDLPVAVREVVETVMQGVPHGGVLATVMRNMSLVALGEREVYWALDPRNPTFTYAGASAVDAAVRTAPGNLVAAQTSAATISRDAGSLRTGLDSARPVVSAARVPERVVSTVSDAVQAITN